MSAPAITRDVSELDLAAQREAFKVLEREWQELDRAQGIKARELRACGESISALERKLGMSDDYTNGNSHVKVGT